MSTEKFDAPFYVKMRLVGSLTMFAMFECLTILVFRKDGKTFAADPLFNVYTASGWASFPALTGLLGWYCAKKSLRSSTVSHELALRLTNMFLSGIGQTYGVLVYFFIFFLHYYHN